MRRLNEAIADLVENSVNVLPAEIIGFADHGA
jgi:hypothetical protein